MPTFWTLCDPCESLYAAENDDAAVELMKQAPGRVSESEDDVDEVLRQPLTVFRRADLGARRLID